MNTSVFKRPLQQVRLRLQPRTVAIVLFISWFGSAELLLAQSGTSKRRVITLQISAEARARIGSQQQWLEMLQDVGANRVVSKTGRTGTPSVEETETSGATLITVTGFIVGNKLALPGGNFSIGDKTQIRALLRKLRDDGAKVAMAEKKAFGLTSEQLVGLHEQLAKVVEVSTKGQNAGDTIGVILRGAGISPVLDRHARAALSGNEKIAEELKGISTGTAIATIARPLGLALQPKREQGKPMEVRIVDSKAADENWPIGWPIELPPVAVEPKLFQKMPIEIRNFPLNDVLDAVEKRAGVPFFYDHNTLAREGLELANVKVTLVQKKVTLKVAISKMLNQSKPRMSEEIRVDENGKPFLWITVR